MNTITQNIRFRQALIEYSLKYGVTKAAIRYKTNRQYIYCWRKRYDGSLQSIVDKFHRPHHHLNAHTSEELKLIADMRKRNMEPGLQELTPSVLNDMVKRVYVHAPKTVDGKRTQEIDIVYDLVGILPQSLFKHEETA